MEPDAKCQEALSAFIKITSEFESFFGELHLSVLLEGFETNGFFMKQDDVMVRSVVSAVALLGFKSPHCYFSLWDCEQFFKWSVPASSFVKVGSWQ